MTVVMHLVITLVVAVTGVYSLGGTTGPYKIKLEELSSCEDEGTGLVKFSYKIKSAGNGVYIYYGPIQYMVPMDEDFDFNAVVYSWSNGGYKMVLNETFRGCKAVWDSCPEIYEDVLKHMDLPPKCPIPKGNYTLNDWKLSNTDKTYPALPYNKYKLVLTMYSKKEKVGCHIAIAEIVAKNAIG